MLPGPVFYWELLTTSRRLRYYVARAVFGLILLFLLWQTYENYFGWARRRGQVVSISQLSSFASSCFTSIVFALGGAVLILVPALAAGVIADEKQRRTLHYLLCSSLTSAEIVLGKAASRFLHLAVILALSLPVLSLLTLLGGISPPLVLAAVVGSATTGFFLTCFAVLVSTYMRKVRDAVVVVYAFEGLWLLVPFIMDQIPWGSRFAFMEWGNSLLRPLYITSPFWPLRGSFWRGNVSIYEPFLEMALAQIAAGFLFLAIAVLRLRPVYRRQMGGETRALGRLVTFDVLPRRWRKRSPCGDHAMYWKELWLRRSLGGASWVARLGILLGLGLLAFLMSELTYDAVREFWTYRYQPSGQTNSRANFQTGVRIATGMIYTIWGLSLAIAASLSITAEREEDTWISLLGTSLEASDILWPKMLGGLWRTRFLPSLMFGGWVFGMILGAIHPLGVLAATLEMAVFSWFIVALGTWISLRAKTSLRAMLMTLAVLGVTNVGYLMCLIPILNDTDFSFFGCMPLLLSFAPVSRQEIHSILQIEHVSHAGMVKTLFTSALGCVLYSVAAFLLTSRALQEFDHLAGRPREAAYHPGMPVPGGADSHSTAAGAGEGGAGAGAG